MVIDHDLTLADLDRSAWEILSAPYTESDEIRIVGKRPVALNPVDQLVGNALKSLATLPRRTIEAASSRTVAELRELPDGARVYGHARRVPSLNVDANGSLRGGAYSPPHQVQQLNQHYSA